MYIHTYIYYTYIKLRISDDDYWLNYTTTITLTHHVEHYFGWEDPGEFGDRL